MHTFQDNLKLKMYNYAKNVYKYTKNFPKDELYGITSQLRRSALSVTLNYIEGYARFKPGYKLQFYENSYGSLKESKFLIFFSYGEKYLTKEEYEKSIELAEEIGKMLWSEIKLLNNKD
ncbi:MAG: four helix bundle protein [Candidatus Magasanikbacteria bacterium]